MKITGPAPVSSARHVGVTARIVGRTTLRYAEGANVALDRPDHVRAGSGLCVVDTPKGKRLCVAQDDASFLALVDPVSKRTEAITLPSADGVRQFDEGRGNKARKLDLECVATLPSKSGPLVVALGSGSSPLRERIVITRVDREPPEVRVVDGGALYRALRALPMFKDVELNLEGMALLPSGALRLFQRGNGAGGLNATVDVPWAPLLAHLVEGAPLPALANVKRWALGAIDGVGLTFTDAYAIGERVYVLASAEDSPNAVDDGVVKGCAFGILGEELTPILDEKGAPFVGKPEGLVVEADGKRAWIVLDKDDPDAPSELLELALG